MTNVPPPTPHPADPRPFGAGWNWRIVAMLALFAAIIAASVITADLFAMRDRFPSTAPNPSTQNAPSPV